jgi:hypothetical protein
MTLTACPSVVVLHAKALYGEQVAPQNTIRSETGKRAKRAEFL